MKKFSFFAISFMFLAYANAQETPKASPVLIQGKSFVKFDLNGKNYERFIVRGVAISSNYKKQDGSSIDILADDYNHTFKTFILPRLKQLNINAVRVYQVDPSLSHENTMRLLSEQNIYVMLDLFTPSISINRVQPNYSKKLFERASSVINSFAGFSNVLAFSVGNEVVYPGIILDHVVREGGYCNDLGNGTITNIQRCYDATIEIEKYDAATLKSLIRDLKAHLKSNHYRSIPIGTAMQDGPQYTVPNIIGTDVVAQYYACGSQQERADFIGINSYRYVPLGDLNAYNEHAQSVQNFPIPVVVTEAGAIQRNPMPIRRDWKIIPQFYQSKLISDNLSGQFAFQFYNDEENLGLYCELANGKDHPNNNQLSDCFNKNSFEETPYGGAYELSLENEKAINYEPITIPAFNPLNIACPDNFNPNLLPNPFSSNQMVKVEIDNYLNMANIVAVQNQTPIVTLPSGNNEKLGIVNNIYVDRTLDLYLLQNTGQNKWPLVCKVEANTLNNNSVIKNDVQWGGNCHVL